MRRWFKGLALVGVVTLLAAGCGRPGGVDGDLTDDWAAIAAPVPYVPAAGVCYLNDFAPNLPLSANRPVDCAESHRLETVHVGTFIGADADRRVPPRPGSAEIRAAYTECDGKAREFVGDEWRAARLQIAIVAPAPAAWSGGARWYRCDLQEYSWADDDRVPINRADSLQGALAAADSPLRLGCFNVALASNGSVDTLVMVDCAQPHNSEFAGVWMAAPDTDHPDSDRDFLPLYDGCYQRVAAFAGVPEDRNLRSRTGVVTVPAAPGNWRAGDRGVRCFLWVEGGRFTRSLKAAGPAGLPVQTR